MKIHLRILIDASGSMGYMKGSKDHENKYLLPDGSTRMSLTKKILSEDVIPFIDFIDLIGVYTFRNSSRNVIRNNQVFNESFVDITPINTSKVTSEILISRINKIRNPEIGGTPIYSTFIKKLDFIKNKNGYRKIALLITDGDSNDEVEFDTKILEYMSSEKLECSIYVIGIDQNREAERKSKNLAEKTKGKYINLKAIDYDKKYINQMLFELKSELLTSSLNQISQPEEKIKEIISEKSLLKGSELDSIEQRRTPEVKVQETKPILEEVKSLNIEDVVKKNSIALNIIGKQLEMITQEIKYIKSGKTIVEEDEDIEIIENKELNIQIGYNAEKIVFEYLQKEKVENLIWNNENRESYKSFDMQYNHNNETHFVECKGSLNSENYFYLTKEEWNFFLNNKDNYKLFYVSKVNANPQIKIIDNLLEAIFEGSLVPYSMKNRNVKAERILFTII